MNNIWNIGTNFFEGGLLFFLIKGLVLYLIATFILNIINKGINKTIEINKEQETSLRFLSKIVKVIAYGIVIFVMLGNITPLKGIGTAVLGATSIFSVVIGLAAQESFGNFIAGFFLAMYHPFKVGDIVRIVDKDITGTVKEITFRHTVLTTFENTKMIVPNSVMNTAILEDKEYGQGGLVKYMSFDIGYDSDIKKAEKLIYEAALSIPEIIDTRTKEEIKANKEPFTIRVDEFDPSGIKITFPVRVAKLGDQSLACSKLRKEILVKFKKNKIEIPYNKIELVK